MRQSNFVLVCVVLAVALLQGPAPTFAQQRGLVIIPVERTMWAVKRANVRVGAGTHYGKVGLLEVGEQVRVTGDAGDWLRIERPNGRTAFVYASLLGVTPPVAPAQQGRQVITYNNARYEGEVRDGKEHGQGVLTWNNGTRYDGGWRNGRHHGQGTKTWTDGRRYDGDWRDGELDGSGTYTWADGGHYQGGFRAGKLHGRGIRTWANGDRYEGNWRNGKHHGRGIKTWTDGRRYDGDWRDGELDGSGTYTWADGGHYQGGFRAGKLHGRGIRTWANGDRYEGHFVGGTIQGPGRYIRSNGEVVEGEWNDNQLVRRSEAPPTRRHQAGAGKWVGHAIGTLDPRGFNYSVFGEVWAVVWDAASREEAMTAVLRRCQEKGGHACERFAEVRQSGCVMMTSRSLPGLHPEDPFQEIRYTTYYPIIEADQQELQVEYNRNCSGCKVETVRCSN